MFDVIVVPVVVQRCVRGTEPRNTWRRCGRLTQWPRPWPWQSQSAASSRPLRATPASSGLNLHLIASLYKKLTVAQTFLESWSNVVADDREILRATGGAEHIAHYISTNQHSFLSTYLRIYISTGCPGNSARGEEVRAAAATGQSHRGGWKLLLQVLLLKFFF